MTLNALFFFIFIADCPKKSFSSLPSIFGYLGKETKNTDEHVIMKKILNKDFVHSGSIGLI